jgi:branched-chain amino acid transport system substrate-binding protein
MEGRVVKGSVISSRIALVFLAVVLCASFMWSTCNAAPSKDPIVIGGVYDLTGPLSTHGRGGSMTAKAAIDRINKAGGIAGRQVKYIVEDSATDPATGLRKLRKLILKDKCDFVLIGVNSGVAVGAIPLAKEMNTIIFTEATARDITGKKGNRYVFRAIGDAEMAAIAMARFARTELGKNAYGLGADYEWGHSVIDMAEAVFAKVGLKMLGKGFSPVGTLDFVPYLSKVPKQADFLVAGYFTNDVLNLVNQAWEIGLRKPVFVGSVHSIRYKDLGPGADLVWCGTYGSRSLSGYPQDVRAAQKAYRNAVGLNDEGWDKNELSAEYIWAGWEGVSWIKKGVEDSGWKSRDDNLKFMKALEGATVKTSIDFPTGGKTMRAEDHQALTDIYVLKAEKGSLVTKARVSAAEILPSYPPLVDFRKE